MTRISIIIPALNESSSIRATLNPLQTLRKKGHEIILVDGGSSDDTMKLSRPLVDLLLSSQPGRARQMNAGARKARGPILLFLHADTQLPADTDKLIVSGLAEEQRHWGRFDVRLSGRRIPLRLVEKLMNLRSRLTGIATGDQAIFVRRELFETLRGFPDIPLMEDIAMCRRLKKTGPPLCLRQSVVTSSRRWEKQGILRTILLMWSLRMAYFLGVSPEHLARRYGYRIPCTPRISD